MRTHSPSGCLLEFTKREIKSDHNLCRTKNSIWINMLEYVVGPEIVPREFSEINISLGKAEGKGQGWVSGKHVRIRGNLAQWNGRKNRVVIGLQEMPNGSLLCALNKSFAEGNLEHFPPKSRYRVSRIYGKIYLCLNVHLKFDLTTFKLHAQIIARATSTTS